MAKVEYIEIGCYFIEIFLWFDKNKNDNSGTWIWMFLLFRNNSTEIPT